MLGALAEGKRDGGWGRCLCGGVVGETARKAWCRVPYSGERESCGDCGAVSLGGILVVGLLLGPMLFDEDGS